MITIGDSPSISNIVYSDDDDDQHSHSDDDDDQFEEKTIFFQVSKESDGKLSKDQWLNVFIEAKIHNSS